MKSLKSLLSGAVRALRSWRLILVVWIITLLPVALFVIPARGILKAGFGDSTITGLLRDGINIDVFSDLDLYLSALGAHLSSGLFMVLLTGILLLIFFTGGLFKSVNNPSLVLSFPCFFRASAKYFFYFLGIWFSLILLIVFSGMILIGIPAALISQSGNPGGILPVIIAATLILFIAWVICLILVADYSRAWLITMEKPSFFKALGHGFSQTFGNFVNSFFMMVVILITLLLFSWLMSIIISSWKPVTGGGVFLLFIVSQMLIIMRLLLKTWRYGSVTSLMELNKPAD